ncbi:hypothetical protein [Bacteroides sp. 51]|uniref:hypothetical protein n=1 Tax=Bacteroides sp. 51 TaxID=2302938 RepID=UPI0013D3A11C|nr:hypothetical protein [Bacteroides sp. 51]NDV82473.1 hypothetical protein [Bacteroides sp. 51]
MTVTGKRAQEIREKRISDKEEDIQDRIDDLSCSSDRINDHFSDYREMKRKGQKKDRLGYTLKYHKEQIENEISELEDNIIRLKSLNKDNCVIPHYQQKVEKWREALNDLDDQLAESKSTGLFSGLFNAPKKEKDITLTVASSTKKKVEEIEVFSSDSEKIKATLAKLSTNIDSKIEGLLSTNKAIASDISKFDTNIAVLKSIAPDDSIISYFESKQKEWKTKMERAKLSLIVIVSVVIIFFLLYSLFTEGTV